MSTPADRQYLRRDFPPPLRTTYGPDRRLDYFHTDTREFLGSEFIRSNLITPISAGARDLADQPVPVCVIAECLCTPCLRELHNPIPAADPEADPDAPVLEVLAQATGGDPDSTRAALAALRASGYELTPRRP